MPPESARAASSGRRGRMSTQLHQLGDEAIAGRAVEPAEARQRGEIGQQDVVAHRLVHHQAEPALARHHADAGGDGIGGMPAAGACGRRPRPPPARPRRRTGGAASDRCRCRAGRPARSPRRRAGEREGSAVEQQIAGWDRRGDHVRGGAAGHRSHQIGDGEGAARDRRPGRRAARCSGRRSPPPRRAGARCRRSAVPCAFMRASTANSRSISRFSSAAVGSSRMKMRHRRRSALAMATSWRSAKPSECDRPVRIGIEVELGEHRARVRAHARAIDHRERSETAAPADRRARCSRRSTAPAPGAAPAGWSRCRRRSHRAGWRNGAPGRRREWCRGRDDGRRRECGSASTCRRRSRRRWRESRRRRRRNRRRRARRWRRTAC